jgi:arginine deiminase
MQSSSTAEQPAEGLQQACERGVGERTRPAAVELYAQRLLELGRGRGGPRCMSYPVERDAIEAGTGSGR